jgi:hypothetical protein
VRRVLISDKLYEKLVEEAGRRGLAVEELVAEILSKALNITLDPQDRAELHLGLAGRLLAEAEELVAGGTTPRPRRRPGGL